MAARRARMLARPPCCLLMMLKVIVIVICERAICDRIAARADPNPRARRPRAGSEFLRFLGWKSTSMTSGRPAGRLAVDPHTQLNTRPGAQPCRTHHGLEWPHTHTHRGRTHPQAVRGAGGTHARHIARPTCGATLIDLCAARSATNATLRTRSSDEQQPTTNYCNQRGLAHSERPTESVTRIHFRSCDPIDNKA
jgi:hypothetical protein